MQAESGALAGKVAIVSGGSGAMGRAILDAFDQIGVRAISLSTFPDPVRTAVGQMRCP